LAQGSSEARHAVAAPNAGVPPLCASAAMEAAAGLEIESPRPTPRCSVEPLTVRSALTEGSPQLLQRTFGSLEELRDFDRMLACRGESVLKAEDASCSCSTRDETGSLCESPGEPSLDAVRRSYEQQIAGIMQQWKRDARRADALQAELARAQGQQAQAWDKPERPHVPRLPLRAVNRDLEPQETFRRGPSAERRREVSWAANDDRQRPRRGASEAVWCDRIDSREEDARRPAWLGGEPEASDIQRPRSARSLSRGRSCEISPSFRSPRFSPREREAADRRVASRASSLERSRASGARERRALRAENEALRAQIQACAQLMRSQDTQSETPVSILVACVALLFFALLLSLFA